MGRGENTEELSAAAPRSAGAAARSEDWKTQVRVGIHGLAQELGAQAYEVGGSIRDEILGSPSKDLDVCLAGSTPEALLDLVQRTPGLSGEELIVAERLVGVRLQAPWTPPDGVELAMARRESSTGPGHTEFAVDTGEGIKITDDLLRRDFTVNAIAQEILPSGELGERIDPLGGAADAEARILRQANPHSLAEDPLRALRGVARIARDGLSPDAETLEAMRRQAESVRHLTQERIRRELEKTLMGASPDSKMRVADALRVARDTGLLEAALPELAASFSFDQRSDYHGLSVDEHCFAAAQHAADTGASNAVRWAALLHDSGKPASAFEGSDGKLHYYDNKRDPEQEAHELISERLARQATLRLRFPVATQEKIGLLVREHMFGEGSELDKRSARRQAYKTRSLIERVGRDNIDELLQLRRCDRRAKYAGEPPAGWDAELVAFERMVARERSQPLTIRELAIGGNELLELGAEGPKIGEILRELQQRVLAEPERNTPEQLLSWAEKLAPGKPQAELVS